MLDNCATVYLLSGRYLNFQRVNRAARSWPKLLLDDWRTLTARNLFLHGFLFSKTFMQLYSVFDSDGQHFRKVDEGQAETLLDNKAAYIDTKRRRIRLRLTVDPSAARAILNPNFFISSASRTFHVEHVGDDRRRLYQHSRRCEGFGIDLDG